MRNHIIALCLFLFFTNSFSGHLSAQELEPRALTALPKGLNFAAVGYAFASGNTLLDPALPLEDFNGNINTIVLAYVKSIDFFGKSGKIDAILPFAGGDFKGVFQGESFKDSYTGFGDLRLRATINLTGAPALEPDQFKSFKQKTVTGLGVQVTIPTGNYKKEQLPNLGSNRWSVRINYGISQTYDRWVLEAYVGAWFFSENKAFLGDNSLEQSSLWVLKANIIKSFNKKGMWLAFSTGFGYGGQSYINTIRRDAVISQLRLGATYALPLDKKNILKFAVGSGIRFQEGADFDVFGVTFSHLWLDKQK